MKILQYTLRIFMLLMLISSSAWAGGLYIREFGQPTQGMSGGQVLAEDASLAFQNPSGLFKLDSDSAWMVTGMVVDSKVEFDKDSATTIPGNNGGDAGGTMLGGSVFHTRRLSEDWGLTFSLNSFSGSALDYGNGFVGRYQGDEVELLTVAFTPSIALQGQ